jgi:hypothetical protein
MAQFGQTGSGTPNVNGSSNTKYATYFVMPTAGSVTDIQAWLGSAAGVPSSWVRMAIYEYAPGSLLKGSTGSVQITGTASWQGFNFSSPLGLPAGSYALAALSSSGLYMFSTSTANRGALDDDTFPGWDTSWVGGAGDFTIPWLFSFYANYNEVGGGSTYWPLTTVVSPAGAGSINPSGLTYQSGTVNISAQGFNGSVIGSWLGGLTGSQNPTSFSITGSTIISGIFMAGPGSTYYNLITRVSPAGAGTITPSGTTAQSGTVTLTASPSGAYQFSSWTGDVSSSSNPYSFTIVSNTIASGNFIIPPSGQTPINYSKIYTLLRVI